MTCLCCGRDAGYNRAVVDRFGDVRLGGLCLTCEEREFGATLRRTERGADGCALCSRDGSFALPAWRPYAEEAPDGTVVSRVDYRVDAATVHLCDRHLQVIDGDADGPPSTAADARPLRDRR